MKQISALITLSFVIMICAPFAVVSSDESVKGDEAKISPPFSEYSDASERVVFETVKIGAARVNEGLKGFSEINSNDTLRNLPSEIRVDREYSPIPEENPASTAPWFGLRPCDPPPQCFDQYPPGEDIRIDQGSSLCSHWQRSPFAATMETGEFLTFWVDGRFGTSGYIQRYGSNGEPEACNIGISFSVVEGYNSASGRIIFAADREGNFVVTSMKAFSTDIICQRYDVHGMPLDSIISVIDYNVGNRFNPSVAMAPDGQFVIVWEDERISSHDDIFAQRFDASGTPVGPNVLINDDATLSDQWTAAVAIDDLGRFVIVWQDGRNDSLQDDSFNDSTDVYLQCFEADGMPMGDNLKVNDSGSATLWDYADVAHHPDGSFVVTWRDRRGGEWRTHAQRFDVLGQKVGSNITLALTPEPLVSGRIATQPDGGFSYVYVGEGYGLPIPRGRIYLQHFDSIGTTVGTCIELHSSDDPRIDDSQPFVATGADGSAIVVWKDTRFGSVGDIGLQRYGSDGQSVGDNTMVNVDDADQWWPNAEGNNAGASVIVWWEEYNDGIFARRFSLGQADGDRILVTDQATPSPLAVAVNEEGSALICWIKYVYPSHRVYSRFMGYHGVLEDSIYRADTYNGDSATYDTWLPVAAAAGNRFMMAWTDYRNNNYDVYGRICDSIGVPIGADFRIDDAPDLSSQFSGEVCGFSDGTFGVVWTDRRTDGEGVYLRRFDSLGNALSDGIKLNTDDASHGRGPTAAVLADGSCLVIWYDSRSDQNEVYGRLVDGSGEPVGVDFRIGSAPSISKSLDMLRVAATGDDRVLAVWRYSESSSDEFAISSALMDRTGAIIEDNLELSDPMFAHKWQYAPAVAPAGDDFLAVWMDNRRDMGWDIYARVVPITPDTTTEEIHVNIEPGSCPNVLALDSKHDDGQVANANHAKVSSGVLSVAILGSVTFDVSRIDITTLTLEGAAAIHHEFEDVGRPEGEVGDECKCNVFGPDGLTDLVLQFKRRQIVDIIESIGVSGLRVPLVLKGSLVDGRPVSGTDCVVVPEELPSNLKPDSPAPIVYALHRNYPNPFNPTTEIRFVLPVACHASLEIYNMLGQKVASLVEGPLSAGTHSHIWDGSDASSGVYFYRLVAGGFVETRKMVLMK